MTLATPCALPWVEPRSGPRQARRTRRRRPRALSKGGGDRIFSFDSAEGKCHVQALAREINKIEEMREEMREHNKKTDRIVKLTNKTKQETEASCALFKGTVGVAPACSCSAHMWPRMPS